MSAKSSSGYWNAVTVTRAHLSNTCPSSRSDEGLRFEARAIVNLTKFKFPHELAFDNPILDYPHDRQF